VNPISAFFLQFKLYFILAGLLVLTAGSAYLAWDYRGAVAEREKTEAVSQANKDAQAKIETAEAEAKLYRDLAEVKYSALMEQVTKIKVAQANIGGAVAGEVKSNPKFYNQPLPEKGWEQWRKARELYNSSASQ
jgi:hypothetical protein